MSSRLTKFGDYHSASELLGNVIVKEGTLRFLAISGVRPNTPHIVNVSTSGAGWTAVITGATNIFCWKLREEEGNEFDYAYTAAPAAYMTTYGDLDRDTEVTDIYVRRRGAVDISLQLEYWTTS